MASSWRSNLKSPRKESPHPAHQTVTSPREQLSKTSPRQDFRLVSPRDEKNTVKSRWSYLSSSPRIKSPRKESPQLENKIQITADELIARKFSAKKPFTRQRSKDFLRAVQKFEGEIPGKLLKPEEVQRNLENEKLEFCSNELVDMKKFLEQIEMDFSSIRQRIVKVKDGITDLKRSNRLLLETE